MGVVCEVARMKTRTKESVWELLPRFVIHAETPPPQWHRPSLRMAARIGGDAGRPPLQTFTKPGDPADPPYLKAKTRGHARRRGTAAVRGRFSLIAETTLERLWHRPVKDPSNPVHQTREALGNRHHGAPRWPRLSATLFSTIRRRTFPALVFLGLVRLDRARG